MIKKDHIEISRKGIDDNNEDSLNATFLERNNIEIITVYLSANVYNWIFIMRYQTTNDFFINPIHTLHAFSKFEPTACHHYNNVYKNELSSMRSLKSISITNTI